MRRMNVLFCLNLGLEQMKTRSRGYCVFNGNLEEGR